MSDHVYAMSKFVGSSSSTIEDAIENALAKAAEKIDHLSWFQVVETRGFIKDNKVAYYQVTLEFGSRCEG